MKMKSSKNLLYLFKYIFLPRGDGRCETLALGSLGDPVEDDFASCDSSGNRAKQEKAIIFEQSITESNNKGIKKYDSSVTTQRKKQKDIKKTNIAIIGRS